MKVAFWVILMIGLSSACFVYIWEKTDVVRVGYELNQLSKRKMALEQEYDHLRLTYSQMTALGRIAREASTQLGMRPPSSDQVIFVDQERGNHQNLEPLRVVRWDRSVRAR